MRKLSWYRLCRIFLAGLTLIFFSTCRKEKLNYITIVKPLFKTKADVLANINGNPGQPVIAAGKLFIKGQYIFLNDIDRGIHIIDNSQPSHPVQAAFLSIPGNQDVTVKGNILYADMYGDLLAIDISDLRHAKPLTLLPAIFKDRMFVNGYGMDSSQVIVDWIKKDTLIPSFQNQYEYFNCSNCGVAVNPSNSTQSNQNGIAGSMARFVMMNDYIYAISASNSIDIINTDNAERPALVNEINSGFNFQTIFPFNDKLFLGSSTGMYIYDLSDPRKPKQLGQFEHIRSCDPVVTDGNYAYVTLHSGSICGGNLNELEVIDIKDLIIPSLANAYPMEKPGGLCKDGNLLFVCDGSASVKVYDATNAKDLQLKTIINSDVPYDVIAVNHIALVVGKSGLYQYDYNNLSDIKLLSFIPAQHKN